MKRITVFFIFIALTALILPTFADETDASGGIEDAMKYTNFVENGFEGQKKITDEDFQKTLAEVKARQHKKGKKNKQQVKGKDFNQENNGGYINETAEKNLLLSVPLELTNGDGTDIPIGHYKIVGEKTRDNVYIDLYQTSTMIARVPAIETNSDFDQPTINFVQLLPYNDERIKIIYGSMDFNAYTFIKIKNKISDTN